MVKNYTISGNPSKGYRSVADNGQRASFTARTQAEVVSQTRQLMQQNGGGELRIQNIKGQYRAADTVPPKKDSFPPRG